MLLQKTDKAREELRPGVRTLSQRERTVLLLADGGKTLRDFGQLFGGTGQDIASRLVQEGYLQVASAAPVASPASPSAPSSDKDVMPQGSADKFEGRRSLATTRMFLFDICERMFARRSPALADHFRETLRQARDRGSMLAAARQMIAEIERLAGPERADSISERIAMLLPPEDQEQHAAPVMDSPR